MTQNAIMRRSAIPQRRLGRISRLSAALAAVCVMIAVNAPADALAYTRGRPARPPALPHVAPARWTPPPPRLVSPALVSVGHPAPDGRRAFDRGLADGNSVALTFDADMTTSMLDQLQRGLVSSWLNEEVINVLKVEQVPATMFLTGLWAKTYPATARALAQDDLFEIGNHTLSHTAFRVPCYGLAAAGDRTAEIEQGQAEIAGITGVAPRLMRFPGDCYDESDVALAASRNLLVVSGDVRSADGFSRSSDAVVGTVMTQLRPGSIVIMHLHGGPYAPATAPALRAIITAARERGLQFAKVSRILGLAVDPTAPSPKEVRIRSRREPKPAEIAEPRLLTSVPWRLAPLLPVHALEMPMIQLLLAWWARTSPT
jgi:peptidoglycan/xylan/chitin deacetylase (PgdA/CDA1 family)